MHLIRPLKEVCLSVLTPRWSFRVLALGGILLQSISPAWLPMRRSKTPSQAVLRLRGRLNVCYAVECAFRWAGGLLWLPRFHLVLPKGEFPGPLIGGLSTRQLAGSPQDLENYNMRNPLSICSFFIYTRGTGALANAVGSEQNYLLPQTHLFRAVESYGSWG